jgi:Family of unknown function (DUF5681)
VGKSSTSFKPGQSGNPKGRQYGSKNANPSVRDIVNAVVSDNTDEVMEAYRKSAVSVKSVLHALELKARVNREIGDGHSLQVETDADGTVRATLTWPESMA